MYENPRPALYGARYEAVLATRPLDPPSETVAVAGRCCESGDVLIWEAQLPQVRSGDVLAVFSTGAYTYSMASNYNRFPRPAVVLAGQGRSQVVVERETYEDLVRKDVVL
jgi:diaminopimelate decarboxylase